MSACAINCHESPVPGGITRGEARAPWGRMKLSIANGADDWLRSL